MMIERSAVKSVLWDACFSLLAAIKESWETPRMSMLMSATTTSISTIVNPEVRQVSLMDLNTLENFSATRRELVSNSIY